MKKKVAIQGIAGSYHDIAARNYFEGEEIEIIGCNTFRDVISTIKKDPSILGMMAIENTIAGSLLQNHELIRESGLQVIGEYKLRISHSLVALPGTNIHDVKEVNSHPIALMQCTDFLDTLPNAKVVEKEETAKRKGGEKKTSRHERPVDFGKPTEGTRRHLWETGRPDLQHGSPCRRDRDKQTKLHPLFGNSRPMDGRRDAQR